MVTRILASIALVSALGASPIQAYAFGLGNIETSSALNEPFKAKITVTALRDDEKGNVQVRLASDEEFDRAGIERSFLLTKFKFEVVEKAGSTTIFISSKEPIKEPFVDFLLTATTGNGRLIREYTVLLDPPKTVFAKSAKKQATVAKKLPQKSKPTSYQYTAPSSPSSFASTYGPTNRTDTLWAIALQTKQDESISVQQMMMALFKANPRAFNNNNINGLRAGYILSIPSADEVRQLSKKQAISAASEQNDLWKNRNAKPAPAAIVEDVAPASTSEEIESSIKSDLDSASGAASETLTGDDDVSRLKLVAPNDNALLEGGELSPLGSDEISRLSEQLTLAQETLEGQVQENIDIKERMTMMEEQIQTLHRMISIKDADLARLQGSLEQDDGQQTEVDSYFEQLAEDTSAMAEEPVDSEVMSEEARAMPEGSLAILEDQDVSLDTEQSILGQQETETGNAYLNKVNSLVDKAKTFVVENTTAAMSAAVLLLLGLWLLIRRRNRPDRTWDEALGTIQKDAAPAPVIPTDNSGDDLVEEIGELEEDDINDIELPESDIEESTEFQQAETESLDSNISELENAAEELSDLEFNNDELESKESRSDEVLNVGSDEQDDELMSFDSNADVEQSEDVALDIESLEDVDNENLADEPLSLDIANDDSSEIDDEPLTLDIGTESSQDTSDDSVLELDINADDESLITIPGLEEISEDEMSDATAALTGVDELELDIDDVSNFAEIDEVDEAETKLDLAAAYIDMDDPDGAKSILNEVANEGNDEQKTRAQAMLKDLS